MNSGLERVTLMAGMLVLVASLEFGMGVAGPWAAVAGGLLLGIPAMLLWLRLDLLAARPWLPPVSITGAVLLGVAVLEAGFRAEFRAWFAVLAAALAAALGAGGTQWLLLRHRVRCNLCNRRLASQAVTFRCPRCSQLVCEETCWNFEHRRCQLCLEQRVHVLPTESSWWMRVTAARVTQGRCQVCLADAAQADLRACPRCRRLQCRDCWDFCNGECGRCAEPLPDLPESLSHIVGGIAG